MRVIRFNFGHINAFAEHGFRPTPNFRVHKKEPRPAEDAADEERCGFKLMAMSPARKQHDNHRNPGFSPAKGRNEADHGMLGTANNKANAWALYKKAAATLMPWGLGGSDDRKPIRNSAGHA